ncbi:MAG: alpha/beta hydrolase, partial [Verrucomicrobiota bacterium]
VKSVVTRREQRRGGEIRHLFDHVDSVTGVHHVFVTISGGEVYRASYAPEEPGSLKWHPEPELEGRHARIMSHVVANDQLYLAVDISADAPGNGGLFRRIDGPKPSWEWLGEWGSRTEHVGVAWIRGMTAIPDPSGSGREFILASRETDGVIEVIDPAQSPPEREVEFDFKKHCAEVLGASPDHQIGSIIAYNEMTPAVHPDSGEKVRFLTGGARAFLPGRQGGIDAEALLLVRHEDRSFASIPVVARADENSLRAVRTIVASPFPEESGRTWYLGGFDAAQGPHRNTAWIYRAELPASTKAGSDLLEGKMHRDLAYGEHERNRLDLYEPPQASSAPIMVYVHGGGWRKGDKSRVGEKAEFFTKRGWVFASVNYRLLPDGAHPSNVNDVAAAIAWIHGNADEFGANPDELFLMGHSAGAHLVALVATWKAPLKEVGLDRSVLKGVISLDTNTYDLVALMEGPSGLYRLVFGEDEETWREASPITHLKTVNGVPPFFVAYSRGVSERLNPKREQFATSFAKALEEVGVDQDLVDATDRDHGEINQWFGLEEDEEVTGKALDFLERIRASGK